MKTLLFFTLILSQPVWANNNVATAVSNYCSNKAKFSHLKKIMNIDEAEKLPYPGSGALGSCQTISNRQIPHFYNGTSRSQEEKHKWEALLVYSCSSECEKAAEASASSEAPKKEVDDVISCVQKKMAHAIRCESVAYQLARAKRKWSDTEINKADKRPIGEFKCTTSGVESIDFEACVDFAESFMNFEAVQQVAYQGQQLVMQEKTLSAQSKVTQEKDAAKGALKATKESVENQQDLYNQRAAVDGAKLAMLYSKYQDMPDKETVAMNCKGFPNSDLSFLSQKLTDKTCIESNLTGQMAFDILPNQAMRDKMKAKLIQVAASAGQNMLVASLLGKRAGDIDKALAKVDEFKPVDPFVVSEEVVTTTYCKTHPDDPKCAGSGMEREIDGISDNIITFGEGATGTTYTDPYNNNSNAVSNSTDKTSSDKKVTPMGNVMASAQKDNSMEKAAGASVKIGGTGGGGGGGGGGGSLGGGGGGGGGLPNAPAEGGTQAAVQGKTPTYGGGEGSLSMMGGFGINKPRGDKAKDDGNPFGKLFDKDGAKNGGALTFREPASVGKKGDNIFDMISKRYGSVKADNRLLEYELSK